MDGKAIINSEEHIEKVIYPIRGLKVILSPHLADLYQVEPRVLVQAVKRNIERFPKDFMFQLTDEEFANLKSQIVISRWGGPRRSKPYAFTEQGVAMLSSVLRSKRAVQVNIEIMRTFVRLRQMLAAHADLVRKVDDLEKKYDKQFKVVFDAIRVLMAPPDKKGKKGIGFTVKEKQKAYSNKTTKKKKTSLDGSFTPKAKKIWEAIAGDIRIRILNNVWCGNCGKLSSIGNLSGKVESGMLVLRGSCTKCGSDVVRVIENE